MKVIAAVDIMGGSVVRLVKGDPAKKTVYSSDPVDMAKKWEGAGADMLHIVDLDAAFGTGNNSELVASVVAAVKIPVEVAGGIRTLEKAEEMLDKASRVVLGTMAYGEPEVVRKLAKKNPGRVIVSIDQIQGKVMVKGWKEPTGSNVVDAILQFSAMGVGEFLLTNIERDGTMQGLDVQTMAEAAKLARIIASGGITTIEDIVKVRNVGCSSVILGRAMYEGKISIDKVKALA